MRRTILIAAIFVAAHVGATSAHEFEAPMKQLAETEIRAWLADPVVVEAVKAQNATHGSLSPADVVKLDKQWRAETGAAAKPLIDSVLSNKLSAYLKGKQAASKGLMTEIFVMDDKGLNVGQSDVTSDYWQGDEAKWQETFLKGASAVHVSDVAKDESTQSFQSQISLSIVDPSSKTVIGAVTVGVNVELLAQ
jgi:hypothetical protein